MSPEDLSAIAHYMYGEIWQTALADDLGIGTRTVRKWLTGTPLKKSISQEICQLARLKQNAFGKIEKILIKYE